MRTFTAVHSWELEEIFLWWRRSESWFIFSWNLSAEFSVKAPSSSMLRGQLFSKQHSAVFTRYIGAYFIGKYKICYAGPPDLRLENSLKLAWCLGVQRREQISWNLWCLSCRRCPLICPFVIWIDEKIQFGCFLKDVFHLVCSPQSLLHVSFRSKIVHVHQNCFDLLKVLATEPCSKKRE